jgi:chorismate-pyruvate lyase
MKTSHLFIKRTNASGFSVAKKVNQFIILFTFSCLLFACATDSDKIQDVIIDADISQQQLIEDKPTINQLLQNRQSMTRQLENIDADLDVDILYTGMQAKKFKRIVSLRLNDEPILIGVSQARKTSPYFVKILKNAYTTSIGKALFAKNSQIKRDANMRVMTVHLSAIKDIAVRNYIAGLGYDYNTHIYKRISTFRYKKQSMQLIEYILPSINQFVD